MGLPTIYRVRSVPDLTAKQLERFHSNIIIGGNCNWWIGYVDVGGYGRFRVGQYHYKAHRVVWQLANGPAPLGMVVHHTCFNRRCCKLSHLALLSFSDNVRMTELAAKNVCKKGHEYTKESTYTSPDGKKRCRTCRDFYMENYNHEQGD